MADNEIQFGVDIKTQQGLQTVKALSSEFATLDQKIKGAIGSALQLNKALNSKLSFAKDYETLVNRAIDKRGDAESRFVGATTDIQRTKALKEQASAIKDLLSLERQLNNLRSTAEKAPVEQFAKTYGSSAVATQKTLGRVNNNAGVDFLAVQARILLNYQLISKAYQAAGFLTGFVVDLDKNFHQLQAISASTDGTMAKLQDRLIKVSQASKFTAVEVSDAAVTMAQAGLSAREVGESIDSVIKLATASGSDLKTSVDVVTSVLSVFDLQTGQTAEIANVLTSALNLSKLTIDKFALGLQYSGNLAAESNVSYKELAALLGAISNAGIRAGSTLGTGLRQLFTDLLNPTEKFKSTLQRIGLTLADVDPRTQTFVGVLTRLKEAGFTASDALASFDIRGATAFTALSNNVGDILKLEESFSNTTAASKANETQMQSLANVWARFTSVSGTFAAQVAPPAIVTLNTIISLTSGLLGGLQKFPGVLTTIGVALTGLGISGVVVGLAKMVAGLKNFLEAAKEWRAIQTGLSALGFLGLSVSWTTLLIGATVAITAAVGALYLWKTAMVDLDKEIDDSLTKVDKWQGEVDTITTTLNSVQKETERTVLQFQALNDSPALRRARITEINDAFAGMGLQLDANTSSVKDLVDALEGLSVRLNADLVSTYGLELAQLNDLIDKTQKKLEEVRGKDAAAALPTGFPIFATTYDLLKGVDPRIASQYRNLPGNTLGLNATKDILAQDIEQRRQLSQTSEGSPDIAALDKIISVLEQQLELQKQLATREDQRDKIILESQVARLNGIPAIVGAQGKATDLSTDLRGRLQDILTSHVPESDRKDALEQLKTQAERAFVGQKLRLQYIKAGLGGQFDDKAIDKVTSDITNSLAALDSEISAKLAAIRESVNKGKDALAQYDIKNSNREIDYLLGRAKGSSDTGYVQGLAQTIQEQADKQKQLVQGIFDRAHEDKGPISDEDQQHLNEQKEEIDRTLSEHLQTLLDETQRIFKETLDTKAGELKSRYDKTLKAMHDLRDDSDPKKPQETIKQIGEELKTLQRSLEATVKELAQVNLERSLVEAGIPSSIYGGFGPPPDYIKQKVDSLRRKAQTDAEKDAGTGSGVVDSQKEDLDKAQQRILVDFFDAAIKNYQKQVSSSIARASLPNATTADIEKSIAEINDLYRRIAEDKKAALQAAIEKGHGKDSEYYQRQQEELNRIEEEHFQKVLTLYVKKLDAVEKDINQSVKGPKSAYDLTQNHVNEGKFGRTEIERRQLAVENAERVATQRIINDLLQKEAELKQRLAAIQDKDGTEANTLRAEQAEVQQRLNQAYIEQKSLENSTYTQSFTDRIKETTKAFLEQRGVVYHFGDYTIDKAQTALQQVGDAWNTLLGGLTSGFETFFTSIATGTASAGAAFKAFAVSVLQMLIQIIAKSLATQIALKLFGGEGTGGGVGGIIQNLIGGSTQVPGSQVTTALKSILPSINPLAGTPAAPGLATPSVVSTAVSNFFKNGTVNQAIAAAAAKYPGVSLDYLNRIAFIESKGIPGAMSPTGAEGLFQFTKGTASDYGLTNRLDPFANADAAARLTLNNTKALTSFLGRDPTGAELYLAHQQGLQGAENLFSQPDANAAGLLGNQAILGNGGNLNQTASQFTAMWTKNFNSINSTVEKTAQAIPQPTQQLTSALTQTASSVAATGTSFGSSLGSTMSSLLSSFSQGGLSFLSLFTSGLGPVSGGLFGGGRATGGYVSGTTPFRDSKLHRLMPGEFVLRSSAVSKIGRANLEEMNNLGNRHMSEAAPISRPVARQPHIVNLWNVPAEQVPPPGPTDIINVVAQNIQNRGALKTLIQSVVIGH